MNALSRLRPQHACPPGLRVVIVGPSELPGVDSEAHRLQPQLTKAGCFVTCRLAPRSEWGVGRFHPDDGSLADLVVVLGGVGLNYILLQAEFVAVTQFLVYLGAVIVLFLFGVMLTRAPLGVSDDLDNNQKKIGIGVGVALLAVLSYALIESFGRSELTFAAYEGVAGPNTNGRTQAVSDAIFGQYLIPFEMLSLLLLAALIGAIVLARRD